ncbi:MAG: SUMF1/EgtB/PvdO family nonheme iron enzyme [Myxococcales bacterium]|nr:SUMF1/EgtB/PvdO family nonheme iron enzyme [Myxococcales bacterium]
MSRWFLIAAVGITFGCETEADPLARPDPPAAPTASVPVSVNSAAPPVDSTLTPKPAAAACPSDMQEINGDYCPFVGHRCLEWANRAQGRCARFEQRAICEGRVSKRHFCMDRYEFPNQAGALPVVMVSWFDAEATCRQLGKRLCTESEWNFACEGEARLPYPYGYERDAKACNIDRKYRFPDFAAFDSDRAVTDEVLRLDQRVLSGELECLSPFGVHDLTGNVDEWVVNESGKPYPSGLKGGYWGPIRARCRPMTTFHNQWFRFYQVGFRCCSDVAATSAGPGPAVNAP